MKFYWKDIEEPSGSWGGVALHVEDKTPFPGLRLLAGENARIRLDNQGKPMFWATIAHYHEGAWYLSINRSLDVSDMPISPIHSAQVELTKTDSFVEQCKTWCRYFIHELRDNRSSFLYDGAWVFSAFVPTDADAWHYRSLLPSSRSGCTVAYDLQNAFLPTKPHWIEWMINGSDEILSLKKAPPVDDGRVKWWRKTIRERYLPPILLWYVNCLDAYIIVDGHCRLQASLLENVPPTLIAAYSINEIDPITPNVRKDKIVQSLEKRKQLGKRPLSVEEMNDVLLKTFETRAYMVPKTASTAVADFNATWEAEVKDYLHTLQNPQHGQDMIERNSI